MNLDYKIIQERLCHIMCAEVKVVPKNDNLFRVETPFYFPDGDPYQIYIREMANGTIRLSDMGHTLMQLSYSNDPDKFRKGTRQDLLEKIKAENELGEINGEFFVDTSIDNLPKAVFNLGQGITKIYDLTFLNRNRVQSTFYEDLKEQLYRIIDPILVIENYQYPELSDAYNYQIDYKIEGIERPLYLFGVQGKDKARLTTITIQQLLNVNAEFDSLLVFSDLSNIPNADLARLTNVGGEIIASLDAEADFKRKLKRKVSLN